MLRAWFDDDRRKPSCLFTVLPFAFFTLLPFYHFSFLAEVRKHVMKDSARLNSYGQLRAEVVDLLRAEAALPKVRGT